jgi:hypothetical protein
MLRPNTTLAIGHGTPSRGTSRCHRGRAFAQDGAAATGSVRPLLPSLSDDWRWGEGGGVGGNGQSVTTIEGCMSCKKKLQCFEGVGRATVDARRPRCWGRGAKTIKIRDDQILQHNSGMKRRRTASDPSSFTRSTPMWAARLKLPSTDSPGHKSTFHTFACRPFPS